MKKNFSNASKKKLILVRPQKRHEIEKTQGKIQSCVKIGGLRLPPTFYAQHNGQLRFSSINASKMQKKQTIRVKTSSKSKSFYFDHFKQKFSPLKLSQHINQKNYNFVAQSQKTNKQQTLTTEITRFLSQIHQRGILIKRDNLYQISMSNMFGILFQFYTIMLQNKQTSSLPSTKSSLNDLLKQENKTSLSLQRAFSLKFQMKKQIKMSYNLQVLDCFFKYEPIKYEEQVFWALASKFQRRENNASQLNFLLQKLKYLQGQIGKQSHYLKQLSEKNVQLQELNQQKTNILKALQDQISKKQIIMAEVDKKKREFDDYLSSQPNKILAEYAAEYKEKQQTLFDMAYMLQESTPQQVVTWIGGLTNISDKCFHLTSNDFFSRLSSQSNIFSITRAELERFKCNIESSYIRVTKKLQQIIQSRYSKIKEFVSVMQKLASFTVGKREFLDQINNQMSIAKLKINKQFEKIDTQLKQHHQVDTELVLKELKALVKKMEDMYMKAQVFY